MSELSPEQVISVPVEVLLAAAVESAGRLEIPGESMKKDYGDKVLAIDYDMAKDVIVITLVERDDVVYDDDTE